jgi:hypothetical protein
LNHRALAVLRLIALNANRINGFAPEDLFSFQRARTKNVSI